MISVEPLPAGTTDVNIMEAGWKYVHEGKVLIYGAIDPMENVITRLDEPSLKLRIMEGTVF